MTDPELKIIREIARHQIDPNPVQRLLGKLGVPFEKAIKMAEKIPLVKRLPALAHRGVDKALRASILAGGYTFSDESVLKEYRRLDQVPGKETALEIRDQVADRFRVSNAVMLGAEGALMGLGASVCEGFPGAQLLLPAVIAADIAASMTLLSRHASQVAASYGYSPKEPKNLPHVIASMVPYSDQRQAPTEEEGFFVAKSGVIAEVRAASSFLASTAGLSGSELLSKGKAPLLVRLVQTVATRLEVSVTQKELAMLVPLAGAGLNGAVNVAFQQAGHLCTKDYFRRIVLAEKYGDDVVRTAIVAAIVDYQRSK